MDLIPYANMDSSLFGKNLLDNILRKHKSMFTQWSDFRRRPVKLTRERYICLLKGREHFKLISPIFR